MSLQEILAAEQRNQVVSKLHSILKPFVLRRLKSDVEIALPRKMEVRKGWGGRLREGVRC